MAGETVITLVGNLTADPELRFTPSGAPVANFTVASTPRTFDRQTGEWRDGDAMFLSCAVWRQAAENVAESLQKGMRVIVQGRLKSRSYETREGERRTVFEVDVDEIGPALKYATAKVTRTSGGGGRVVAATAAATPVVAVATPAAATRAAPAVRAAAVRAASATIPGPPAAVPAAASGGQRQHPGPGQPGRRRPVGSPAQRRAPVLIRILGSDQALVPTHTPRHIPA